MGVQERSAFLHTVGILVWVWIFPVTLRTCKFKVVHKSQKLIKLIKLKDKATLNILVPPKLRLLSATSFVKEV